VLRCCAAALLRTPLQQRALHCLAPIQFPSTVARRALSSLLYRLPSPTQDNLGTLEGTKKGDLPARPSSEIGVISSPQWGIRHNHHHLTGAPPAPTIHHLPPTADESAGGFSSGPALPCHPRSLTRSPQLLHLAHAGWLRNQALRRILLSISLFGIPESELPCPRKGALIPEHSCPSCQLAPPPQSWHCIDGRSDFHPLASFRRVARPSRTLRTAYVRGRYRVTEPASFCVASLARSDHSGPAVRPSVVIVT